MKLSKILTLIALIGAILFSVQVYAQPKPVLVFDETYFQETKAGHFKVITSNEKVSSQIIREFSGKFVQMSLKLKKDRKGPYYEYIFYFGKEKYNEMVAFIDKLNKK